MGNRDYKNFAPNCYYHIYNRGVGKMKIFKDVQDYRVFLGRLKENLFPDKKFIKDNSKNKSHTLYTRKKLPPNSFSLIAYCLMPNHFHILLKQEKEIPVSQLVLKFCTSYSKYFNLKYKRVGSLFQDQFKSVLVDDNAYLLWLTTYIHLNPRIAGLVSKDVEWEWGSYREYLNFNTDKICNKKIILGQFENIDNYKREVEEAFQNIKQRKTAEFETDFAEFEPLDGAHQGS